MLKPAAILAPSEAYRASLAVAAQSAGVLLVDEFTSVLDRRLAAGVSVSTAKLARTRIARLRGCGQRQGRSPRLNFASSVFWDY